MSEEVIGELVIKVSAGGSIRLRFDGPGGNIWAGGNGADGDLVLFRSSGDNTTFKEATVHLDGQGGNIWAGGNGSDGDLVLFPSSGDDISDLGQATVHVDGNASRIHLKVGGQNRIRVDGGGGNVWLGGNGADGDLVLFSHGGDNSTVTAASIHLDGDGGNIWAGGQGRDGDLVLFPSGATNLHDLTQATIHLDAQAGDIKLSGADCAEDFAVADKAIAEPGTVLVAADEDLLEPCSVAYDKRVAGVVSGAGGLRPGVLLGKGRDYPNHAAVALTGKTFCRIDASYGSIEVGDLITTSPTTGYAMKATDAARAFGAVLGKALRSLKTGKGLIPVLVCLQ